MNYSSSKEVWGVLPWQQLRAPIKDHDDKHNCVFRSGWFHVCLRLIICVPLSVCSHLCVFLVWLRCLKIVSNLYATRNTKWNCNIKLDNFLVQIHFFIQFIKNGMHTYNYTSSIMNISSDAILSKTVVCQVMWCKKHAENKEIISWEEPWYDKVYVKVSKSYKILK